MSINHNLDSEGWAGRCCWYGERQPLQVERILNIEQKWTEWRSRPGARPWPQRRTGDAAGARRR